MSKRRSLLEVNQRELLQRTRGVENGRIRYRSSKRIHVQEQTKKQRTLTEFNIPTTSVLTVKNKRPISERVTESIELLSDEESLNGTDKNIQAFYTQETNTIVIDVEDGDSSISTECNMVDKSEVYDGCSKSLNLSNTKPSQRECYNDDHLKIKSSTGSINRGHNLKTNNSNSEKGETKTSNTSLMKTDHSDRDIKNIPQRNITTKPILECPICSKNLTGMELFQREAHCDNCFEQKPLSNFIEGRSAMVCQSKKIQTHLESTVEKEVGDKPNPISKSKNPRRNRIPESFKILTFTSGYQIIVDGFTYPLKEDNKIKDFFLSHFHSDHYIGLKKSWTSGNLYSSPVTYELLKYRYTPKRKTNEDNENITNCLKALKPYNRVWLTDTISVTTLDANHCPGASLFFFEEWNSMKTGLLKTILHTGDFRSDDKLIEEVLKYTNHREIDEIYLDTTYLLSTFTFPAQEELLNMVARFIEMINNPNFRQSFFGDKQKSIFHFMSLPSSIDKKSEIPMLYLVGTYSIGKEKLAIKIAETLNTKIYVQSNSIKRKMVSIYWDQCFDNSLLTDDPSESQIHLVSLKVLRDFNAIDNYLKTIKELTGNKIKYDNVFGFIPTGWTFGNRYKKDFQYDGELSYDDNFKLRVKYCMDLLKHDEARPTQNFADVTSLEWLRMQYKPRERYQIFRVPYSEHSSFRELLKFCISVPSKNIISTVNVDNGVNSAETSEWFKAFKYIRNKLSNN